MKTIDIKSEEYREYVYADGTYRIESPVEVHVTDTGSHRVIDKSGVTHRPADKWLAVRWKPMDGQPAFVA